MNADQTPKILATVTVPPIVSFASNEEPQLDFKLKLCNSSHSITLHKHHSTFWPLYNSVRIRNLRTGKDEFVLHIQVCYRGPMPELRVSEAERSNFITLSPDETAVFEQFSFRPLGKKVFLPTGQEHWTTQLVAEAGLDSKYRIPMTSGMYNLQIGGEYSIEVKPATWGNTQWMRGTFEDLAAANNGRGAIWAPAVDFKNLIATVAGDPIVFRVVNDEI